MIAGDRAGAADTGALMRTAQGAMQRGDLRGALDLMRRAEAIDARTPGLYVSMGQAFRMGGDREASLGALERALVVDPYDFVALLLKGVVLEEIGLKRQAAKVFRNAVAIAPPETRLPPDLQAGLRRAREAVKADSDGLYDHLQASLKAVRARHAGADLDRFDEGLEIFVGRKRVYNHEPLLLHYPRLPPIAYWPDGEFPWLKELEAATPMIQEELASVMAEAFDEFTPYIDFPAGVPVNQWGELDKSRKWSTFFLWKDGKRLDEACARAPKTAALLESLPLQYQPGFAPTAMFSALQGKAKIPPHTGSANTRLIVHLPLVLPGPAYFRVGNETRRWEMGKAWVFDDSIEHEAWNESDQTRVILIFDVWNPLLSEAERELVTAMMAAKNTYQAE
jgi:aspartyl/asparaginyl beta-hydroxylase (cupin superfamily)